ncbi:hypothetical protein [Formosa sp. PL04]|uniref:hypothetical protein n=1 Tax=Formosa sp. PL04 TaxID=3081755 RepID=UPI002981CD90|nr:hypothetical protein [Formosa sp. PL04]MDW5288504.1 hypothetical protein [Formosa sp. PL04]
MKEIIIENKGEKYSEMLYKVVEEFDKELPAELSFENTLEIGIEAWNLANKKEFLESNNLYQKELENYEYSEVIDKMVSFKLEHFSKSDNIIVDYSTENDTLKVKTQTAENHFNSFFNNIVFTNSKQTTKK